ncbi:MAG TPA: TetR/AcrR family transcriptional regulator [Actinomycetota bacterium]
MTAPRATSSSPRRTRARRGEGEKLREQILEVAERLLVETGDEEAVTIRAVADAVGVTPPSVYLHFADKDELLFAICERHFAQLDRVTEEAAAGSEDLLEALALRGKAYIRFGVEHPEQYRILFMRKPSHTPEDFQVDRLRDAAAFNHLVEHVAKCVHAGLIEGDPLMISLGLWAMVHGLTSLLIAKPDFPWPDLDLISGHVCRTAIRGLSPR